MDAPPLHLKVTRSHLWPVNFRLPAGTSYTHARHNVHAVIFTLRSLGL